MIPYSIRTFRGGISDESDKGIAGSFKHGHALDIHKRDDTLSCKQAMATVLSDTVGLGPYSGTTMTGIINVFLPASDGSTYAFSDKGSIFARTGEGNWTFVYNDEDGAIKGAGEFEDTNGNNYIFWATSTQISRKPFPGVNSAPDTATMRWTDVTANWKTENVLLTDWHPMKLAGGALNIGNRQAIAIFDFNANFNPAAVNVRPGNEITCLEERDDYLIMGSQRLDDSEEGHIWSWVSTALNYVQKKKIPVKGVNALIHTEYPLLQGGDDGEIFFSDLSSNNVPQNRIPGKGRVTPHGVTIENDLAMFGFHGSTVTYPGIWSYGRRNKNRSFALNYEYRLTGTVNGSTVSTIGAILLANSDLLSSWGTTDGSTSDYGVDQVSSTTKATALYEGLEFDAGSAFLKKKFDTVKVTMSPLPASTSISIKFKLNKDTSWKYAVLGDRTTTFTQTDATVAIFNINRPAEIYEVGAELNPSANTSPEILSITTYLANEKGEF